jgi:hypothetical protein
VLTWTPANANSTFPATSNVNPLFNLVTAFQGRVAATNIQSVLASLSVVGKEISQNVCQLSLQLDRVDTSSNEISTSVTMSLSVLAVSSSNAASAASNTDAVSTTVADLAKVMGFSVTGTWVLLVLVPLGCIAITVIGCYVWRRKKLLLGGSKESENTLLSDSSVRSLDSQAASINDVSGNLTSSSASPALAAAVKSRPTIASLRSKIAQLEAELKQYN